MGEVLTVLAELFDTDAVGWSLVLVLMASIGWIASIAIKNHGELQVAKESAAVSLNEQGAELLLKMVEMLKEEVAGLRESDGDKQEVLAQNERLCDYLIAILKAPDDQMRRFQMDRARIYLQSLGKWPKE